MSDKIYLDPAQCRAARALIGWSRETLSERCGVAASTLADFEASKRTPYARTLVDVRKALEAGGVEFLEAKTGTASGPGVRLVVSVAE
ncbi:helix-turn-helix domain-containing protein [Microvirga sp. CF3016]|uniref:helix-turn-helix domain-containing protein n=1 Tax=Microvirga sp. CF3016 TaxID=3110181 RepID=UPI002E77BC9F|nr:helix-turn-helix transcriptional regulator [Microvirga sp. CF3016]MEE1612063.1 helix-turn-helix transcriptional regulator [Microvirga sp. CF3016]